MKYLPLDMKTGEIRLLTVHPPKNQQGLPDPVRCSLNHVSFRDTEYSEEYRAWISSLGRPPRDRERWTWRAETFLIVSKFDEDASTPPFSTGPEISITASSEHVPVRSRYTWGDYFALSYTWGDPHDTRKIFVDGQVCHVTKNLEEALRTLREHEVIRAGYQLWVDSLCINQNDMLERSQQVRRMQDIYGKALDVVVWLGNEEDDSGMALDFVNALSGCWDAGREDDLQTTLRRELYSRGLGLWRALHQLTARPYWRRLWVTQELILGTSDMLVLCGDRTAHWQDLYHVLYYFNDPAEDRVTPIVRRELKHAGEHNERLSEEKLYWRWGGVTDIDALRDMTPLPDLMTLFTFNRHKEATDPRDMIYGLLGLMEGSFSRRVKPDYDASVHDVFIGFAREWIGGTSNLEILGQCDDTNVPSWCPDWSMRPYRHLHSALEPRYDSSARSEAIVHFSEDGRHLTCKGLRVDSVDGMTTAMLFDFEGRGSERQAVMFQSKNGRNAYGSVAALNEALWRTMVGNRHLSGQIAPDAEECLLSAAPTKHDALAQYLAPNAAFMIAGRRLDEYFHRSSALVEDNADFLTDAVERVERFCWSRRLIATTEGFVGMVPHTADRGDVVCILLGCSFPMLLRPHAQFYRVVGPCYVHGIMEGEAVDWLHKGTREIGDISIF